MTGAYERLLRPALFRAYGGDPERVHSTTLRALHLLGELPPARRAVAALCTRHRQPATVAGIDFPGRVGLAAGMDKNGEALKSWAALGFGHAELGTVTARPQPGNTKPRLFRLPESGAVLNRMGFNNAGAEALVTTLRRAGVRRGNRAVGIPLGISLGKSKAVALEDAAEDYLISLRWLDPYADYLAVNVSSPNTPGLRTLQDSGTLRALLLALTAATAVPVFVKLAPDLTEDALAEAVDVCEQTGAAGLIATNTTLSRNGLAAGDLARAEEAGGLSGAPLTVRARHVVRFLAERTELPIIGVGGVMSADDGQALFDAGAQLVQIWTGFVYSGPRLVDALNRLEPQESR